MKAAIGMITAFGVLLGSGALAQQPSPSPKPALAGWPCEGQPKPALVLRDYWPNAPRIDENGWRANPSVLALVGTAVPRNMPIEDAIARIRDFAKGSSVPQMAELASGLVAVIDGERREIIAGIWRFGSRQDELVKRLERSYVDLGKPAPPPSDVAGVEKHALIQEQVQWDTRIFEDRQRMLPIICRLPGELGLRLSSLISAAKEAASKPQ